MGQAWTRRCRVVVFSLLAICSVRATATTELPADLVVYGKRPPVFRDGSAFPPDRGIWEYRQATDDPMTRLKFREVPGLVNHLGLFPDRIGSYGKYVFVANSETNWLGGHAEDLTLGIFDSEAKQFCAMVLDPLHPQSSNNVATANPRARQSRVFVAPGNQRREPAAPAFGYLRADLDAADPCSWPFVGVTAAELNAGYAPDDQLCPGDLCVFDAMAMLGHEDVSGDPFGRDWVALPERFSGNIGVARIDASGVTVVATYPIPYFNLWNAPMACYESGPARRPSADFRLPDTRPANDWRFLVSYDSAVPILYSSPPPSPCAPAVNFCPHDIAPDGVRGAAYGSCPAGCQQGYCAEWTGLACSSDANCRVFDDDFGPCSHTCQQKNSLFACRAEDGSSSQNPPRQCLPSNPFSNFDDHCPDPDETCRPPVGVPSKAAPSQEYRFDKTAGTIQATSPMFSAGDPVTAGALTPLATPLALTYETDRSVWLQKDEYPAIYQVKQSGEHCTVNGNPNANAVPGEHCYFGSGFTHVDVQPDTTLTTFERTSTVPYIATAARIANAMYIADSSSLQYAVKSAGGWLVQPATTYKAAFAYGRPNQPLNEKTLPAEPRRCLSTRTCTSGCNFGEDCFAQRCGFGLACDVDADCTAPGETCVALGEQQGRLTAGFKFLEAGGAPTSLWVHSGYHAAPPVPQTDLFLLRVPVATYLPDNLSTRRPAIAWDGNRLWLVAEHDGQLKYRVRDDGLWSGWYSLAPHNITPAGGAAIIAGPEVRIYSRDTANQVWTKVLTTAATCVPGSPTNDCQWSGWSALPTNVTTGDDIAATYAGNQPVVAVRGANNGVYVLVGAGGWFRVGALMTTDRAPAVAYHAPDARVWIAARHPSGAMMSSRINPATAGWDNWAPIPTTGAPASWWTGPAVVSDGHAVRVLAPEGVSPQLVYQTMNDGSGWSGWRKPLGGSAATMQPAAANVNGEIQLLTYWFVAGMQEAMLP